MTKVEGMAYARAAWTNEVCDEAREKAGVEYEQSVNPPPSQCDRCGETFATHSQLAGHAGVCGADDLRDHLLLQEQQHAMQIRRVAPEMGSGGGGGGGGGSGSGSSGGHPLPLLDPRVDLIHGPSSARKAQYQTRFKDEALSAFEADVDPRTEADLIAGACKRVSTEARLAPPIVLPTRVSDMRGGGGSGKERGKKSRVEDPFKLPKLVRSALP